MCNIPDFKAWPLHNPYLALHRNTSVAAKSLRFWWRRIVHNVHVHVPMNRVWCDFLLHQWTQYCQCLAYMTAVIMAASRCAPVMLQVVAAVSASALVVSIHCSMCRSRIDSGALPSDSTSSWNSFSSNASPANRRVTWFNKQEAPRAVRQAHLEAHQLFLYDEC